MVFWAGLSSDTQNEIIEQLSKQVRQSREHRSNAKHLGMPFEDYIFETVDSWLNVNNFNMSIREWFEQVDEADI